MQDVLDSLVDFGVLVDNRKPQPTPCHVRPMTIDEKAQFEDLEVLDLTVDQARMLQCLGDGWAYPLQRFMNKQELHEMLTFKKVFVDGVDYPMSAPITLAVGESDKNKLESEKKIALKCTKLSE